MKKIILLSLVIITACIVVAGCITKTASTSETSNGTPATTAIPVQLSTEPIKGPLNVSIGNYNGKLPVFIDNTSVGEVSPGKPLNISVNEGHHMVKVCDGNVCEQIDVGIKPAIKISIDFGERLTRVVKKGPLSVSIGNFSAKLPVSIDNVSVGEVSMGKPLNISVSEGRHIVRVCAGKVCEQQVVESKSGKQTGVDFEEQLAKDVPQGPLSVSIGGYPADKLSVLLDTITVGEVSQGKDLNLMVSEGIHTIRVCVGMVCENESVDVKFAQPTYVDFGERLKKDVEFPKPTVRIVNSFLSGNSITLNAEFINPDKTDHTITATFGAGYTYIDSRSKERKNDFSQTQVIKTIKSGDRQTQQVTLSFSKGQQTSASEPSIVDVVIK
jgi:hypothetical protein